MTPTSECNIMKKYLPVVKQENAHEFLPLVRVRSQKNRLTFHKKFVSENKLKYHRMNGGGGEK
jgi:hypothetical protein